MKKLLLLAVASMFVFAGCSSKTEIAEEQLQNACLTGAPDWVINGGAEGGLNAVGAAKIGQAGLNFARTEALANGRDEMARIIGVKVNNMFKSFTQTTGIGEDETVDKLAANVSKQVASQTLTGSRQANSWISSCNELYVLVGIDASVAAPVVEQNAINSFRNDNALWQQFQAQKAQDELDMAIDKEFGANSQPVPPLSAQ